MTVGVTLFDRFEEFNPDCFARAGFEHLQNPAPGAETVCSGKVPWDIIYQMTVAFTVFQMDDVLLFLDISGSQYGGHLFQKKIQITLTGFSDFYGLAPGTISAAGFHQFFSFGFIQLFIHIF